MIACQIATAQGGGDRMSDHRIQISGGEVTADQAAQMLGLSHALVLRAKTIWHRGTPASRRYRRRGCAGRLGIAEAEASDALSSPASQTKL